MSVVYFARLTDSRQWFRAWRRERCDRGGPLQRSLAPHAGYLVAGGDARCCAVTRSRGKPESAAVVTGEIIVMVLTWHIIAVTLLASSTASGEIIKVGYLAARKGTSGMLGLSISGAMTYAVETINKRTDLLPGHELQFAFADTEGDTRVGTRHLTEMICNGTVAFFGPEESCFVEANVAAAFNLPMISYVSSSCVGHCGIAVTTGHRGRTDGL